MMTTSGWCNKLEPAGLRLRSSCTLRRSHMRASPMNLPSAGVWFSKGHRVIAPLPARDDILSSLYSSHIGINGCIRRAQEAVYYPGIVAAIKQMLSSCDICSRYRDQRRSLCFLTQLHPDHGRRWELIYLPILPIGVRTTSSRWTTYRVTLKLTVSH